MADRLVHTQHDFLRNVIDSTAKSLSSHAGPSAKPPDSTSPTQHPTHRSA
jgi:hypothetical protein